MFPVLRDGFREKSIRRLEVRHSTFNEITARLWSKMGFIPLQTLFRRL